MTHKDILREYRSSDHPSRTIGEIADRCGTTAPAIMRILMRFGVVFPKNNKKEIKKMSKIKWTAEMDRQVEQYRAQGLTWGEIGERLGTNGKSVSMRYYKTHKPQHVSNKPTINEEKLNSVDEKTKNNITVADNDELLIRMAKSIIKAARANGIEPTKININNEPKKSWAEADDGHHGIKLWNIDAE